MLPKSVKRELEDKGFVFRKTGKLEGFFSFPVSPLVTIIFEDTSVCVFKQAFTEKLGKKLVVFTELCGYHVFSLSMVHTIAVA